VSERAEGFRPPVSVAIPRSVTVRIEADRYQPIVPYSDPTDREDGVPVGVTVG
jgi:hypothetical protein